MSQSVKEVMEESGIPSHKLRVIYSGVDMEKFKPMREVRNKLRRELGIPENAFVFINVANWNPPVKAQDLLIQAFARLECKDCFLVMAGYDTDKEGKKLAQSLGLGDRFLGLGFREDINLLLNMADSYALSSYLEGLPNALVQAMAVGLVCIATDTFGATEVIQEGYNGFLVSRGSVDQLAKAMEKVYRMEEREREEVGRRAITSAQRFSVENTAKGYLELFRELS